MKLKRAHLFSLLVIVTCVVGLIAIQQEFGISRNGNETGNNDPKSSNFKSGAPKKTIGTCETSDAQKEMTVNNLSRGKPKQANLAILAKTIAVKRRLELEALRRQGALAAVVDSRDIRRTPGAYDSDLYVRIDGEIKSQEDALPQILKYLWGDDKEKLVEAVGSLNYYGTSISDTEVIDRLIELYRNTVSPTEVGLFVSKEEGDALDLKLLILSTMTSSKDRRKDEVFKEAENDVNETIRTKVRRLKSGQLYSPHMKQDPANEVR